MTTNQIRYVHINEYNNLFLIYSDSFLYEPEYNRNKYTSFVFNSFNMLYSYYNKMEDMYMSKFHSQDKLNNNSLLYDINENILKKSNLHMCIINIVDQKIKEFNINYYDEIFNIYDETINVLINHLHQIEHDQKQLYDMQNKYNNDIYSNLLYLQKYLDVYNINKNKKRIFDNQLNDNDNDDDDDGEKSMLNLDFLKMDITKSNKKKISENTHLYNNILLCVIDKYYLILKMNQDEFDIVLYEIYFLNNIEILVYQFFYNYYDSLILAETYKCKYVHQLFAYSIYDYMGRYCGSSLADYEVKMFSHHNINVYK